MENVSLEDLRDDFGMSKEALLIRSKALLKDNQMAVPFSNTKLRVPKGFQNILEGLAREVLRAQPGNIYEFGAQYFEQLLKIRDEEGIDPTENGARMEDRFYNNKTFKQPDVDASNPDQQDAATAIQTKYRQHHAKQVVDGKREENAAVKIQAGYRGFRDREKVLQKKDPEEYERRTKQRDEKKKDQPVRSASQQEQDDINDIDLTDPELQDAAVKIQAGFKGFKARKEVQSKKADTEADLGTNKKSDKEQEEEEEIDIDLEDPEVEQAAMKIQAGFKGLKARKQVQQMKESQNSNQNADRTTPAKAEEEEEIDIDLDDPEVEKAATKIQAGFKGMKARKEVKQKKADLTALPTLEANTDAPLPAEDVNDKVDKSAAPTDPVKEEEEEIDIDLNDPDVANAAVKIQAGFKGMKARKEVKAKKAEKEADQTPPNDSNAQPVDKKEEIDIDLNDPKANEAATKIQAGFKGMQARKEVELKKELVLEGGQTQRAKSRAAEDLSKQEDL